MGPRCNQDAAVPYLAPELRAFIDRVIIPALLERFLRESAASPGSSSAAQDFQKLAPSV